MALQYFSTKMKLNQLIRFPVNYGHTYLVRNALKLMYGNLGSQFFSGGQTPRTNPKGRLRVMWSGGASITWGAEGKEGKGAPS